MGRGRSSLGLVAAACAVLLAVCPPAAAAKKHPTGPGLRIRGVSASQHDILKQGWIGVQLIVFVGLVEIANIHAPWSST